jgi:hypothetical protein
VDDPISDLNMFEAYAMTFSYGPDEQISKICSGVGVTEPDTDAMVVFDAKTEVKDLIDNISASIVQSVRAGDMEKLPRRWNPSSAKFSMWIH